MEELRAGDVRIGWLVSRAYVPAQMRPDFVGQGSFGVAVRAVDFDGVWVELSESRLCDGWYEVSDGVRWMCGDAAVDLEGVLVLSLVARAGVYWARSA